MIAQIPDFDGPRHDRMRQITTPYLEAAQTMFRLALDAGVPVTYERYQDMHTVRWWLVR